MATDATFDNQLQALATATANFANGKDAQIKNTIITALGGSTQSGGGSTTTLTVDDTELAYSGSTKLRYKGYVTIEGGVRFTLADYEESSSTYNVYVTIG